MGKESRVRNTMLTMMTSFGNEMLVVILKFVTRTVFIRTLGKAYLGINGLFADVISMLSLAELGVDTAITYQLYKPLAEHDDKRVRVLLKFYKQAYRVIGTVILYVIGTVWFIVLTKMPLNAALLSCVVPFLGGDALKILAVCLIGPRLKAAVQPARNH